MIKIIQTKFFKCIDGRIVVKINYYTTKIKDDCLNVFFDHASKKQKRANLYSDSLLLIFSVRLIYFSSDIATSNSITGEI